QRAMPGRDRLCERGWCPRRSGVFFSSRRRHTRSKRDWSSDVCSSDLWLLCDPTHVSVCAETITAAENSESRFGTQSFLLCYFLPSIRSQEHISPCQYSQ